MGVAKITDADLNGKGNIGKADTPGVTISEMQRIMDEIPREVLVPKINAIIDDVNLKSVRAETYTKTETDTAINNKMIAIGAGDMAKSVYDPDGDGIVDDAEKLGGVLPSGYATAAQGAEADALVSGTTPAGNATKFGGALPAAYATAEQGAKADTLAAGAVYSTTEVNTGKTWIDGKTIYRTVFQFTLPAFSGTAATNRYTLETGLAYDTIVSISGMFSQGASGLALYSIPIGADAANAAYSTYVFKSGSAAGRILVEFASGVASAPAFVILEYTK